MVLVRLILVIVLAILLGSTIRTVENELELVKWTHLLTEGDVCRSRTG
jgi:hypothetical protein